MAIVFFFNSIPFATVSYIKCMYSQQWCARARQNISISVRKEYRIFQTKDVRSFVRDRMYAMCDVFWILIIFVCVCVCLLYACVCVFTKRRSFISSALYAIEYLIVKARTVWFDCVWMDARCGSSQSYAYIKKRTFKLRNA